MRTALPFTAFLIGTALLPSGATAQRGEGRLPPVLRKVIAASATLRYSGHRTVTVLRDGKVDRHEEVVMRDGDRLRIEFPKGSPYSGQVIVEQGGQRRHWVPAENQVRLLPARREEGLQRLRALARSGRIEVGPGERLAGYATREVTVRDGAGNVIQRLSIEPRTGAVLRRRIFDAVGTEVGGFVFTQIDFSPGQWPATLFQIERKGAEMVTPWDQLRRLAKRQGFSPVGLATSTGYRLDNVRIAKLADGPVLAQTYTSAGGRVSLFQLHTQISPERLKLLLKRGTLRSRSWTTGGRSFVLMGSVSEAELDKLRAAVSTQD